MPNKYDSASLMCERSRRHAKAAADAIHCAFIWANTAEGHGYWSAIFHRLHALAEGDLKLPGLPRPVEDYRSPCPAGYNTVIGWLATNRPELLADGHDTTRDGFWLAHKVKERGLPTIWVAAPAALSSIGIDKVRAYPNTLIEERFT